MVRACAFAVIFATAAIAQPAVHLVNVPCCQFVDSVSNTNTTTVPAGTTVRWQISGAIAHTITNGTTPTSPGAGTIFNGTITGASPTFQFTFNTAGTFPYHCIPHFFSGMVGTVIVTQPATVTSNGTGCAGSNAQVLTASTTGLPQIGSATFALNVAGGPANGLALLFGAIGAQNPPFALSPSCNLYLEINSLFAFIAAGLSPIPVPLNGAGAAVLPFPVPASFAPGTRLDLQWAYPDAAIPGGIVASNALILVFGS